MNPTPLCQNDVREDLKAYVDGELPPTRRFIVGRHLANCADCRQEIEELKIVSEKLKASEGAAPALAPALRSRLLSTIDQAVPTTNAPIAMSPLWRRKPLLVWGGGGAALAASVVAFATIYNPANQMTAMASKTSTRTVTAPATAKTTTEYDENIAGGSEAMGRARSAAPSAPAASAPMAADRELQPQKADTARAGGVQLKGAINQRPQPMSTASAAPIGEPLNFERQVHKEASIGVSVPEIEAASSKVEEMVKASGGFVASNNLSTDDASGDKTAALTVRVPVTDFDTMMQSFAKLGAVVAKNVTGEDITEKTSDATSAEQVLADEVEAATKRLRSESMSEKRTGQKEAELRELRLRLAQTRARLGLLRKMAALATINISLTEKHKKAVGQTAPVGGFFTGMQETNHAAMLAFQSAVRVPLVLVIWVLAFSPIWVPLVLAYRWAALKTLAKAAAPPTESN